MQFWSNHWKIIKVDFQFYNFKSILVCSYSSNTTFLLLLISPKSYFWLFLKTSMMSPYVLAVRSPEVSCLINSDQTSSFEIFSVLTTFFCSWPPLLFSSFLFRLEAWATEPLHIRRSLLTRSLVQTELFTQMWMISSWSGDSTATELTSRMWTRDTDRNTSLEDSLFLNFFACVELAKKDVYYKVNNSNFICLLTTRSIARKDQWGRNIEGASRTQV